MQSSKMRASTFYWLRLVCLVLFVTSFAVKANETTPAWAGQLLRRLSPAPARVDAVVAKDGTGRFITVSDATEAAPRNYRLGRHVIYIKKGVYDEIIRIPKDLLNLTLLGDGMGVTVITGSRGFDDGYSMPETAIVGVDAPGFMLQDLTIRNTAGPTKHQAVALRSRSIHSVVYKCSLEGFQDTLFAENGIQFYRDCQISGTVDFIYGEAAAVFQNCLLLVRVPSPGQPNVITAQGRRDPFFKTGFVFQFCNITGDQDLRAKAVKTYLGRPWKAYSRVVFMNCIIDNIVDSLGYVPWNSSNFYLDTLFYAEFNNSGPGSILSGRVRWPGFHVLDATQARKFTVARFIEGKTYMVARHRCCFQARALNDDQCLQVVTS